MLHDLTLIKLIVSHISVQGGHFGNHSPGWAMFRYMSEARVYFSLLQSV